MGPRNYPMDKNQNVDAEVYTHMCILKRMHICVCTHKLMHTCTQQERVEGAMKDVSLLGIDYMYADCQDPNSMK
jgi:hypothetical protein